MSGPEPVDLAGIEARMAGAAAAARLRQEAVGAQVRAPWEAPRELSPLVARSARSLDDELPRRYRHAIPALDQTWAWLDAAADGAGLLLLGPTGTGKTYEAYGALRAWAGMGAGVDASPVVFGNAADLLDACRPGGSSSVDRLAEAGLLLVDDVGAFKATEWTAEVLYRVIDRRWSQMLPTLLTTNLTTPELAAALGDRLTSRIAATMTQVPMVGTDRRRSHP